MTDENTPTQTTPEKPAELSSVAELQVASWWTVIVGALALIPLCLLVQWLEMGSEEKGSLVSFGIPPVAIIVLTGMVLAALTAGLVKRFSPRANFVLLYAMLVVGVTICSTGLVRPLLGHITGVMDELLNRGVQTVRSSYERQSPVVYPKLPGPLLTPEQEKTAKLKAETYGPLTTYFSHLERDPRDITPVTQGLGYFESVALNVQWWFGNRLMRDSLGGYRLEGDEDFTPEERAGLRGLWTRSASRLAEKYIIDPPLSDDGKSLVKSKPIPWSIWGKPLLVWGGFSLLVITFLITMAEVLRRIWLRIENLPMPLVEVSNGLMGTLPGAIKKRGEGITPLLLLGLFLGFMWVSIPAAAHFRLPLFDRIDPAYMLINLSPALLNPPFSYIGYSAIYWSPVLIAIFCLVSLEVSRSIWGVYVLGMITLLVLGVMGVSSNTIPLPDMIRSFAYRPFPFWDDQAAGAMLIMTAWMLWASRSRIWEIFVGATVPGDRAKIGDWLIHPRILPFLLVLLPAGMVLYGWLIGVKSILLLLIILGLFIAMTIAAARLRAETGLPLVPALVNMSRYNLMFGGPKVFGAEASAIVGSMSFLSNSAISILLPNQLEIIALAERQKVSLKRMAWGMFIAAAVALLVCLPMAVFWQYSDAKGLGPNTSFTGFAGGSDSIYILYRFAGAELTQGAFEWVRINAMLVGGFVMLAFLLCRTYIAGFPLHPVGFLVLVTAMGTGQYFSPTFAVNVFWGPALLAWIIKSIIFRIGGMELFVRFLPLFRGVIIGYLIALAGWAIARGLVPALSSGQTLPLFFTW
jgi:hypothetical protein